jgi:hypothetical protein
MLVLPRGQTAFRRWGELGIWRWRVPAQNAWATRLGGKARKRFFFEKKKQKTFITYADLSGEVRDSIVKVFCFFFSKKKRFLKVQKGAAQAAPLLPP